MELAPDARRLFLDAGWRPGRRVAVPAKVPTSHPAHSVLEAFGGLSVGTSGPGIECASSDIAFAFVDDAEVIPKWNQLLGVTLIGVAECHNRHGQLYVDESGRCFGTSMVHDAFYFEGHTFGEATERILLGRRARPLLEPDHDSVTLYGDHYRRGDPRLYRWETS